MARSPFADFGAAAEAVSFSRRALLRAFPGVTCAGKAFAKQTLTLASGGRSPYQIFLSPSASPSEQWAAQELRRHLQEMTGAVLPIILSDAPSRNAEAIAIGRSALTDSLGVDPPTGESFALKTAGRTVIVAGGRERGTMYGVYALLEKFGCRWFTADVARVPKMRDLRLPAFDERRSPAFYYREVFFTEALGKEWSARNRLNGHFHQLDASIGGKILFHPFAHSFYDLAPPAELFGPHPEYFAFVAGRRRPEGAQLCLTNPEVVRLAINRVNQWIAEDPDASLFSVSQNDGGGWCECEPCRRVIEEEGATSGLLLRFVNAVAKQTGKTIDTLAYRETFRPPAKVRPLSNVCVRLCPIDACQAHSYFTCPYNAQIRQTLSTWSRIAPKLYLWMYGTNFAHYLMPFPNLDEIATDLPKFHQSGISGIFVEGAGSGGGIADDAELRSYIAARLLWSPSVDVTREIRGFMEGVYGPAAPAMSKYLALQHREVRHGQHLWIDQDVSPLDSRSDARTLLLSAHEHATSPSAKKRIERRLLSMDYLDAIGSRRFQIRGEMYTVENLGAARAQTDAVIAKAQALGLAELREGYPLSRQASDLKAVTRDWEAVPLTDGMLTAVVVPELEARVVAMIRGGRAGNALRVPDPGEWAYPRAGGLFVRVYSDYFSRPVPVFWGAKSTAHDTLTLAGVTDRLALTLVYRISGGVLKCEVMVENPSGQEVSVALRWQAEFPLRPEARPDELKVLAAEGGESILPGVGVRVRFSHEQAGRVVLSRSFRNDTKTVWNLWSPEAVLTTGERMSLASEYAIL